MIKVLEKKSRHQAQSFLDRIFNCMGKTDGFPHVAAFGKLYDVTNDNIICDYFDLMELWMKHNEPRPNRSGGRHHELGYLSIQ